MLLLGLDKLVVPIPRAYDVWSLARLEAVMGNGKRSGRFDTNRLHQLSAECREAVKFLEETKFQFEVLRMAYAKGRPPR